MVNEANTVEISWVCPFVRNVGGFVGFCCFSHRFWLLIRAHLFGGFPVKFLLISSFWLGVLPLTIYKCENHFCDTYDVFKEYVCKTYLTDYCTYSFFVITQKISPPSPYTVVKGALDTSGPVLKGTFQDEEISISVMRMVDILPGGSGDDYGEDSINQLFLHIDISKPGVEESLHFLCGLYPDALGIHSVTLRPKGESSEPLAVPTKYNGPVFE